MNEYTYKISLRIRHPSIDAETICREIGIKADRKWSAGDQRTTPAGRKLDGVYEETYCTFSLDIEGFKEISTFLKYQISTVKNKKQFFNSVISSGGNIEYFIGWNLNGNTGDTFSHELLRELADLGISLSFDLYP
ncbi:MAG: hypothetical protein ACH255_20015 [Candidatus Thiodiazotropha sp.]